MSLQQAPRVQVRMSEDLRAKIQQRARERYWSVNAEILANIERGIAADETASGQN